MTAFDPNRPFMETATIPVNALLPFELNDIINGNERIALASIQHHASIKDEIKGIVHDAKYWVEAAAEIYNTSKNIRDYIMVPTIIMPTDLANRNQVGFPFKELTRFNRTAGKMAYQSWRGQPCHVEHQNQDHTQAKGIIFDSIMKPMRKVQGNLWKVICLGGWDRTKDPKLGNAILTRERTGYSMGSLVRDYECSICDARLSDAANGSDICCEHLIYRKPDFKLFEGKLNMFNAIDPIGYELSSVSDPAYLSAINPEYMTMFED